MHAARPARGHLGQAHVRRRLRADAQVLAAMEALGVPRQGNRVGGALVHQHEYRVARRLDRTAQGEEPLQADLLLEGPNLGDRQERGAQGANRDSGPERDPRGFHGRPDHA